MPSPWFIAPFVLLLGLIALGPLLAPGFWHRHHPRAALGLGAVTVLYYALRLQAFARLGEVARDYVSFMTLIGALFIVSGGIQVRIRGEATPLANTVFLLMGALLANVLGTTGASMLLIRPWLQFNRYRATSYHVVFFIFLVSNVGGLLTPLGDPPLFLGYLRGVPFWWVAREAWAPWLLAVALLAAVFFVVDQVYYRRAPAAVRARHAEPPDHWGLRGWHNLFFLGVIVASVFVRQPPFLREALMAAAALGSWFTTRGEIHAANAFSFGPIREVAILFLGIFATMIPALDWLEAHSASVLRPSATMFFWGAGALSSVLDNAPTYLSFLSAQIGSCTDPEQVQQVMAAVQSGAALVPGSLDTNLLAVLQHHHGVALAAGRVTAGEVEIAMLLAQPELARMLAALSVSAVFFGANTYIGNGPNFLVKSIADESRIRMPTFLGYVCKFTLPFLLPVWFVVWWCFFRG